MPILKHAKKKLRQDKKRTLLNKKVKEAYKKLVKKAKADKTQKALSAAFSSVDKASKKNIIPKNRAARMKASLAKIVEGKKTVSTAAPAKKTKKAVQKKAVAKKTTASKKKTSSKKSK